jgi:xylan 1,4-beta-xylosidase
MHPTALPPLTVTKGAAKLDLTLVRQGVTLLIVE